MRTKKNGTITLKRAFGFTLAGCIAGFSILVSQEALAETRSTQIGTANITWILTPEQTSKIDPALSELEVKEQTIARQIMNARLQIDKLFLQPMPERKPIYDLQSQIDKNLEELSLSQWKIAFFIKNMMSPEQQMSLGCPNPEQAIPGIELKPSQVASYYKVSRPYVLSALGNNQKLAVLHLEQMWSLQDQNKDVPNDNHESRINLPALLSKQKEINDLNSSIAMDRLRAAIAIHDLLDVEQKNKLSHGAEIRIADPAGLSLEQRTRANVPPPEKFFTNTTPWAEEKAKYQSIVESKIAKVEAYKKLRNDLLIQRKELLSSPDLKVTELESVQEKINKLDSDAALERIQDIAQVRDVLNPEQRHAVYDKLQSQVWKATGIDATQDKLLTAIHTKIEAADRNGKKSLANLAAGMKRMYFETAGNDEKILADQRSFNKTQSEMVVTKLECLFEIREVLTEAQRLKLVQLMGRQNHSSQ